MIQRFLSGLAHLRLFSNEMKLTESQSLLADFVKTGSEPAFRELLMRYINLVYSSAVRLVGGDTHLAQDVAQRVFVDLARKARTLPKDVMLGGWLHHHTVLVAATIMRSERRRQLRERQAVEMNALEHQTNDNLAQIAPILDEAIEHLEAEDRTAILLRFFEQLDFRSVGEALGGTEDAARKRVTRALEKLHSRLKHQGVSLSAAALATALATEAVATAPAGLAASIAGTAFASAALASETTLTLLKTASMTKLQIGLVGILVAGAATSLVMQHRSLVKVREENSLLEQKVGQVAAENEQLSRTQSKTDQPMAQDQLRELLRLRGEVGGLRRQLAEVARLRERNTQASPAQTQDDPVEQERQVSMARLNYPKAWMLAFSQYADQNQGQCPTNFEQAVSFFPEEAKDQTNLAPDQFEIVYQGSLNDLTNSQSIIVIREKEVRQWTDGSWNRAYGFADGHSEIHRAADGNFRPWEDQHLQKPRPSPFE